MSMQPLLLCVQAKPCCLNVAKEARLLLGYIARRGGVVRRDEAAYMTMLQVCYK
jgi:hypothetical protein